MTVRLSAVAGILLMALFGGCSHTIKDLCENCGVIRSITPRGAMGEPAASLRRGIAGSPSGRRIPYGAYAAPTVYIVAVRMDWGGISYFTQSSVEGLDRGDRVEILNDQVFPFIE